jgi:hypothetical protein
MTLREKQSKFAHMVAMLLLQAEMLGYEVTLGDAYRDPRCPYGSPKSAHKKRLAIDLNLFMHGKYLTYTAAYEPLGVYWEMIGGTWGGRFKDSSGRPKPDGCHFSLEHNGVR